MVPEPGEWTIPAPLRALLWWPPIAFALAMLQPSAAATVIAATGAGLATLGVLSAAVRYAPSGHSDSRELAPDAMKERGLRSSWPPAHARGAHAIDSRRPL